MKDHLILMLKGLCVGGSMLVPGVSGGSMAMMLGIYDKLISAISSFSKHKQKSLYYLGIFGVGGALGMILFANPLFHLIEQYPLPMLYFFMGAIAGSIPMIYGKAEIRSVTWKVFFYPFLGFITVFLFSIIPTNFFQLDLNVGIIGFLFLIMAGMISAVALILPGISVSYMLLLFGMYEEIIHAISNFYLPYLVPLAMGLLLGTILTTRLLEKALVTQPQRTYLIILGFILGSIIQVFPGVPTGFYIPLCFTLFVLGALLMLKVITIHE